MDRPNIVLLTCHDLGCACGPYGDRSVATPGLDRLAAEGLTFGHHYAAAPLCSPARGAVQTGRYPHVNGLQGLVNRGWSLPLEEVTLAAALARSGYDTGLAGLQHIRHGSEFASLGYRLDHRESARATSVGRVASEWLRGGVLTEPFYLELNTFETHRPWDDDDGSVDPAGVTVPAIFPDTSEVRADLAGLYRHVRAVDRLVDQLLEALDAAGLSERTLFLFTADHGIPFPRCKSTLYDTGLRTALIARHPGVVPAGLRSRAMISGIDLFPTIGELAGLPYKPVLDGRGFGEQLRGGTAPHRQWIFGEKAWHNDYDPMRCVRTERWKYIRNLREGPRLLLPADLSPDRCPTARALNHAYLAPRPAEELYDLHEDPHELTNLADDPSLKSTLDDLRGILDDWMEQTRDALLEPDH